MNFSFLQLLNKILMALRIKKYKLKLKYSKQNLQFLKFLKEKGFISSITRNNKVLFIFLRYDKYTSPVLNDASINSKNGQKSSQKYLSYLATNYIIDLKACNSDKTRLLARFL
jgi:ribosomal protein S8